MINLDIRGLEDLERTLRALGRDASDRIRLRALRGAAEPMRDRMATTLSRSPGGTDHAADQIEVESVREIDGDRLGPGESAVAVGPAKKYYYIYFLEFGTVKLAARGEIRRGYDETCRDVPRAWGEIAWQLIREAS